MVSEDSPAYECGVRSGDVIVTVNDWLITVMDRPQVEIFNHMARPKSNKNFLIAGSGPPISGWCKHCQTWNSKGKWKSS